MPTRGGAWTKNKRSISAYDLTASPDKSVMLAIEFARDDAEKAALIQAVWRANDDAMRIVASEIGWARRGDGGQHGAEPGEVGRASFMHFTARPTLAVQDGQTCVMDVPLPGDPQTHIHNAMFNLVVTAGGHVGSLDTAEMQERVHEFGAVFQGRLADELKALGIAVRYNKGDTAAVIEAIPEYACEAFSKGHKATVRKAKDYAWRHGLDWDVLPPEALALKREDGTATLVGGDYDQVVDRIASFTLERRDTLRETGSKRGVTASALTNAGAAEISKAIRVRLKARGELGADETIYAAIDNRGEQYEPPVATGDRFRLHKQTAAIIDGRYGEGYRTPAQLWLTGLLWSASDTLHHVRRCCRRLRQPKADVCSAAVHLLLGYNRCLSGMSIVSAKRSDVSFQRGRSGRPAQRSDDREKEMTGEQVSRRNAVGLSAAGLLAATAGGVKVAAAEVQPSDSPSPAIAMDPRQALIEAAKVNSPQMAAMIDSVLPQQKALGGAISFLRDTPPLVNGSMPGAAAWGPSPTQDSTVVWGQDFLFVTLSDQPASLVIDGQPEQPMQRVPDSNYWYRLERNLRSGTTHRYTLLSGGKNVGTNDVAAYTPLSYPIPGVPNGTLSEMRTVTSRIYGGAQANYWFYVNAGVDTTRGAPLMVWQDGPRHVGTNDANGTRLKTVTDNLVHLKRIPPMVHLLIAPGTGGETRPLRYKDEPQDNVMRSLQYDSVSGRYGDYILQEVLPEVHKSVKLREDGYSRGAGGLSSGGICSFSLAWFHPDQFSRVHSTIGTFTGMQWYPDQHIDGGYILSNRVRRDEKRNIRVWMSDGMNDIEVGPDGRADLYVAGSWPLNNLQMANALKTRGYDFHFRFGAAGHSEAQEAMDLPEALSWLWRDYDPEKTAQTFEQEEAERQKPIFRVQVANRDAW